MHEVRAGVRLRGAAAVVLVDERRRGHAHADLARHDLHRVADESLDGLLHVEHLELVPVADDAPLVGVLAAGLRVQRGLGEDDLRRLPGDARPAPDAPSTRMPSTVDSVVRSV